MGQHVVVFTLNANSHIRAPVVGLMHSFAGMVQNEDSNKNIAQIPSSLDVMSIFLDFILRDLLNYIIK